MALAISSRSGLGGDELVGRERAHFGVEARIGQQDRQLRPLPLLVAERPDRADDRLEIAELARQRRILGPGDPRGQAGADFLVPAQNEIEVFVGGHVRGTGGKGGVMARRR